MVEYVKHDQRYFAMLNNAVAVSGVKELEGGYGTDAFAYYEYLLHKSPPTPLLQRGENLLDCPIDFNLPAEQEAAVQKGMADLIEIDDLINKLFKTPPADLDQALTEVIACINKNSAQSNSCYLPSGWIGSPAGHYASLKCRKLDNGHYAFSLLNHGSGMSYHQEVQKTGSKQRRIYQSDEYEIDLGSAQGRELLQRLIELQFKYDSQKDSKGDINGYSAADLYGLLKLYGKELPLTDKLDQKAVTPQREGSCSVTNTHAVPRDILVNLDADLKTRKRYHFVLKLRSILDGYEAYLRKDMDLNVLEWGLNEFAVRVNKEYANVLTPEEVIYCGKLHNKIQGKLDQDKNALIEQKSAAVPWPNSEGQANSDQSLVITKKDEKKIEKVKNKWHKDKKPLITPQTVVNILSEYSSRNPTTKYHLLLSLPHCTGQPKDDFWDKVPVVDLKTTLYEYFGAKVGRKDLSAILKVLSDFAKDLRLESDSDPLVRQRALVMGLILYDIAAQLSTDDQYTLGLDDVYSDLSLYSEPEAYFTVKRIVNNFEERAKGRKRVLTNAANPETIHYVINVMLNQSQRNELMRAFNFDECSDKQLFDKIMETLENGDTVQNIVGKNFINLITLSGTAQARGFVKTAYNIDGKATEDYYFAKTHFQNEAKRKNESKNPNTMTGRAGEYVKNLPDISSETQPDQFTDFSENTLYHPRDDLVGIQKKYNSDWGTATSTPSEKISLYPYQLYLSGSIKPDSPLWNTEEKNKRLYDELNEQFRHIECSPNLQIARTLAWISNNPEKLVYAEVRVRINELLFSYGRLECAFANDFDNTLMRITDCFVALLKHYQEEEIRDPEIISWLGQLSYDLRHYAEVTGKVYGHKFDNLSLPSFREFLISVLLTADNAKTRAAAARQLLLSFRNKSPFTVDDCALLLTCRMIMNLVSDRDIYDEVWEEVQPELLTVIGKNIAEFNDKLNPLLAQTLKFSAATVWKIAGSELSNNSNDYWIDLELGKLERPGVKHIQDCTEDLIEANQELMSRFGFTVNNVKFFGDSIEQKKSSDGKWTFKTKKRAYKQDIQSAEQLISIEGRETSFSFNFENTNFAGDASPFESDKYFNTRYQYWESEEDNNIYFVRQENSDLAYFYSKNTHAISQLKRDDKGDWKRTAKVLLNLVNPTTILELHWAPRLKQMFGTSNIRCIAQMNPDRSSCKLERIEHLSLGINFSIDKENRLVWDEDPNYYIADEKSLKVLQGLPTVMVLKHKKIGEKILIPGFALTIGEKNYAFNRGDIINYKELCNETCPYFEYSLDKERELVGQSIESNMYLAILYRSLGDYKRAIKYLDRCKTHHNFSRATLDIAMQALKHPIKSPLGAAFDLKLDCYLQEHQSKWTRETKNLETSDEWKQWVQDTQLPLYNNTFSNYKSGVALLPNYCRLTDNEINLVGNHLLNNKNNSETTITEITPDKRLQKAALLPDAILNSPLASTWAYRAESIKWQFVVKYQYESQKSNTWRTYDAENKYNLGPAFPYLFTFFHELLSDALSKDPLRLDALRKKLYSLLINDKHPDSCIFELIPLLAFAAKYPQYFEGITFPEVIADAHHDINKIRVEILTKVGDVFYAHKDELTGVKCYLIEFDPRVNTVPAQVPLPQDYTLNPVHFQISFISEEAACKHPLGAIAQKYFDKETRPVAQKEFALEASGMTNPSRLEIRLCEQLKRGHEENKQNTKTVYKAKDLMRLADIKDDLDTLKKDDLKSLESIKNTLLAIANQTPYDQEAQTYNLLLSRASHQHAIITIDDLFSAFLKQDPNLLTKKNPFLTQADIKHLFTRLPDYALLSSRVSQIDKAFEDMSDKNEFAEMAPYELQLLASTIDKKRAYKIEEYPEFLVYEYATGRILREDQVNTLVKIITLLEAKSVDQGDMHHALLQFAAGGGKTSVLIPILAHRFARKGYLPVIFNTNELYETGLDDIPKNLRASLQQNMEIIERELEHKWNTAELIILLENLKKWRSEGKCLLMKPVTWHSLNITRKLAYFDGWNNGGFGRAKAAEEVLDFFKTQTIKLEDESQIISDPLQQSIKTFNQPLKPPQEQLDLMLRFYDHLMGYETASDDIQRISGIKSNQKQIVSPDNLVILQKRLAEVIAKENCFAPCDSQHLIHYLLQPERKRPDWLNALHEKDPSTADLVVLARAFIQTHLPHILTMQDHKDYGPSIHDGDLTVAPKHEGKDVTSHFGDHSLVVALTIQMFEQRGLSPTQGEQLLDKILDEHKQERKWNLNLNMRTQAEGWLAQFNSMGYRIQTYKDITPELRALLIVDQRFYKNPVVVKRFLTQFALPQIDVPSERQSSTAAEMQSGFARSLLLSATPGLPEIYPAVLPRENCFLEEAFEAQVIDTLLSPENSKHVQMKEAQTPAKFFEELPQDILSTMTTLIDRGALLTDFKGKEIIESYLGLKVRPTDTGVYFSKSKTHLQTKSKTTIDIPGTALVETLKKQGIKPEQFLLFLFMDLSKTTGVDIKRPFRDVAGLTVGKEQTVTETIQAAMRERQLLDENAQTVTWLMFQSLYREINPNAPDNTFDTRQVFYWMIKNEAKELTSKLINRAYQGIENQITALVWELCKDNPFGFDQYEEMLRQKQTISPWDIYEQESTMLDTKTVLNAYRETLFKKLGLSPSPNARIDKIISETAALIEKLQTPPKIQMNNEVQQEMKLQTEQKQEQEQELEQTLKKNIDSAKDFVFAVEDLSCKTVDEIFNAKITPVVLPGCETIKCPALLFHQKNFSVIEPFNKNEAQKFDQLKPIEILLVKILPDGIKQYRACTAAEADYYAVLLANSSIPNTDPAYAIIGADGAVLSTSNNTSIPDCKKWIKGDETQKMLAYANFLSGRVSSPVILSQLIKELGWSKEDYEKLANTIMPLLVSVCQPALLNNKALYNFCGWGKVAFNPMDYGQTEEKSSAIKMEKLRPVPVLEKDPGSFARPTPQHERALEGYVFGEEPVPLRPTISASNKSLTTMIPLPQKQ